MSTVIWRNKNKLFHKLEWASDFSFTRLAKWRQRGPLQRPPASSPRALHTVLRLSEHQESFVGVSPMLTWTCLLCRDPLLHPAAWQKSTRPQADWVQKNHENRLKHWDPTEKELLTVILSALTLPDSFSPEVRDQVWWEGHCWPWSVCWPLDSQLLACWALQMALGSLQLLSWDGTCYLPSQYPGLGPAVPAHSVFLTPWT